MFLAQKYMLENALLRQLFIVDTVQTFNIFFNQILVIDESGVGLPMPANRVKEMKWHSGASTDLKTFYRVMFHG